MALSVERRNEIGFIILQAELEDKGFHLKPHEVRRQIVNASKKLGIPENEFAEFMKEAVTNLFNKTMEKVNHFIVSK